MKYFCCVRIKSIYRFLLPLFFLLLTGYSRLDIHLFQKENVTNLINNTESSIDYSLAQKNDHTKIKPATKGKRRKRCKAIMLASESQEEDDNDDDEKDDEQNSLNKYAKYVSISSVFSSNRIISFYNNSQNDSFPHEPITLALSDKNILFRVFRI